MWSYLEQVTPKDWGNQKPLYFPFLYLYHLVKKPNRGVVDLPPDALDFEESADCAAERERARDIENPKYVMNCVNVRKKFGSKIAVHAMSLAIETEETFGLLGPNGAGKTTRTPPSPSFSCKVLTKALWSMRDRHFILVQCT